MAGVSASRHDGGMEIFEVIAAERRALADLLADLTPAQQHTQSLCAQWRVHDVLAHLIMPMEVSTPAFVFAMIGALGNFDRANVRLTRQVAQRPFEDIRQTLHRRASNRFTAPGMGPEAPLTDVLVHGLDIRWPLQIPYDIPPEPMAIALDVAASSAWSFLPKEAVAGLRFEAGDLDWSYGSGPVVAGSAEALLLILTGREVAQDQLSGDGVQTFRARLQAR